MTGYQKQTLIFLLQLCLFNAVFPQDEISYPIHVDSVVVTGNKHTKDHIILREIPFEFPAELYESDFLLIQNRIQNLFLFNKVALQFSRTADSDILIISVTESWYFFPLPILFINERDWDKLSYGLQVSHYNFRGRNEKLHIGGWLGYNPSYFISYNNPWIGRKSRFILGISLSKKKAANKIFDFEEDRLKASITIGKRLSLRLQTKVNFFIQRTHLPVPFDIYSASGNGTDLMPTFIYEIKYDNRDLFEYPRDGFYSRFSARRSGVTRKQPDFWRFVFDNRIYFPIYKKVSVGGRSLVIINQGELPIYDRSFLGYSERIRGYFNDVFPLPSRFDVYKSPDISLNSIELRFPILPVKYFSWKDAPFFSHLYRDLKFGISGGIFMDSGIAWQKSSQFALPNFNTGYGAGLHFHLPYVYVIRLEYAWNDEGEGEYIIDMGVSF